MSSPTAQQFWRGYIGIVQPDVFLLFFLYPFAIGQRLVVHPATEVKRLFKQTPHGALSAQSEELPGDRGQASVQADAADPSLGRVGIDTPFVP